MGGFQRTHNDDDQPTDSAGSPATAEGMYARLTASQEASMRQLTQARDAARTQVLDLETTVKELVAAMDDTTKAKVDLQAEFDAFKREAEEGREALVQAIDASHQGQDKLNSIRARIAIFQAQATDLRQGKQRLAALLKEARDEACALHRWNRQELRARREADREASQLRRQVARLMVRPRGRGTDPNASAPAVDTAKDSASASEQKEDQEQEQEQLLEHEVDAMREQEIGQDVIIASLEAALERALAFNEEALDKAAASRGEALALVAARDEAYASRVQAEQKVEGAVRQALAEKEAELESLRGELQTHAARFTDVNVLVQELGEERAQVRALEARLAHYAGVVEAAEAKARASVDEIMTLRIREDELRAYAAEMEAAHGQCETLVAALREERDNWRQRAETEVAEWVGVVAMGEDGFVGASAAAGAPQASDAVEQEQEQEAKAEAEEAATEIGFAAATTLTAATGMPPSSEELGGLDPVEALVEENLALRAELARLRGAEGEEGM